MKTLICTFGIGIIFLIACQQRSGFSESASEETKKPNILLVVADDMGFTDLGCYGSKINTPKIWIGWPSKVFNSPISTLL